MDARGADLSRELSHGAVLRGAATADTDVGARGKFRDDSLRSGVDGGPSSRIPDGQDLHDPRQQRIRKRRDVGCPRFIGPGPAEPRDRKHGQYRGYGRWRPAVEAGVASLVAIIPWRAKDPDLFRPNAHV